MEITDKILKEVSAIKDILALITGNETLPKKDRFSKAGLEKTAREFTKLLSERDEWLSEYDLSKYFKEVYSGAGEFIREEFAFSSYFKQGRSYYYNRTDIKALADELKRRKVYLKRLIELRADRKKLLSGIASLKQNGKTKKLPYKILHDMENINNFDAPQPEIQLVQEDIKRLEQEFFDDKLNQYIDIYHSGSNHAMLKFEYHYNHYFSAALKARCRKWCEAFNYAQRAIELLGMKPKKFIPVPPEEQLSL